MALRRTKRGLLGLGGALLILALAVLAGTLVPRPLWSASPQTGATHRILVLANPIHTDIAVAIDSAVRDRFAFLGEAGVPLNDPAARWLIFGWGGRAFYLETPTWADLKPGPLFKALTIDKSVMHVDVAGEILEPHPAVTPLALGDQGYERLLAFILRSFDREEGRPVLVAGAGYGPNDRFYDGVGSFNAILGCNTWTARGLREAGLRTGWWSPLPVNLMISLTIYGPPAPDL